MSWDEYVTGYLLNFTNIQTAAVIENCNDGGAIIEVGSNQVLAVGGNIELRNGSVDQEQDDGSFKKINVNEIENLIAAHSSQGKVSPAGGIRIKGEKYVYVSKNDNFNSVYLKGNGKGACIAKTDTVYILAVWSGSKFYQDGKKIAQNPAMCNRAVEELQKWFVESGF